MKLSTLVFRFCLGALAVTVPGCGSDDDRNAGSNDDGGIAGAGGDATGGVGGASGERGDAGSMPDPSMGGMDGGIGGTPGTHQELATVQGRVFDAQTGRPLADADVELKGVRGKTDADGRFEIEVPPEGDGLLVAQLAATKAGYTKTHRPAAIKAKSDDYLELLVLPFEQKTPLDADEGGTVTFKDGSTVTFPPKGFVKPDGSDVAGSVDVEMKIIDPASPGEMRAAPLETVLTDPNESAFLKPGLGGTVTPKLLNVRAAAVVKVTQNGESVNMAAGKRLTARLKMKGPPPSQPKVYRGTPEGKWTDEGGAQQLSPGGDVVYEAAVPKVGPIVIGEDEAQPKCVQGRLGESPDALPKSRVEVFGMGQGLFYSAKTSSDGFFSTAIFKGSQARMKGVSPSGGSATRKVIDPGDDDGCIDVGTMDIEENETPSCPGGWIACGDVCADPGSDAEHCGGCDQACEVSAGELCSAGACGCAVEGGSCGGLCVDLHADTAHCGGCDVACEETEACRAGACVPTGCEPGEVLCNTQCVPAGAACCGDGIIDAGEACDDGNRSNLDACLNDCTPNVCGDGIVNLGTEECDDGNDLQDDFCLNDCTRNVCGDGIVNSAVEECDDGNDVQNDSCLNGCLLPRCGDGIVSGSEECDGNTAPCTSVGWALGTLRCTGACTFDASECVDCNTNVDCGRQVCQGGQCVPCVSADECEGRYNACVSGQCTFLG